MVVAGRIATWCLIFATYAFVGWGTEVLLGAFMRRKVVNRGFLIGPICPIYGFGALLMTLAAGCGENILEVFLLSFLAGAILEYSTSYVMEKLFRVRWWDYRHEKFNINGRICLKYLICFGIGGVLVVKVFNPILLGIVNGIDDVPRVALAIIVIGMMLVDLVVSLRLIINCRVTVGTTQPDATEEITEHVREVMMEKGKLNRRLTKAFPTMHVDKKQAARAKIQTQAKAQVKVIKNNAKVQTRAIKKRAKADKKAVGKSAIKRH